MYKIKKIIENAIATLSRNIRVKIEIDKTMHASERQYRDEVPISDGDIVEVVGLALPKIANELMFNRIEIDSYVLIKQESTHLNIIGALHDGDDNTIDFVVVTVMKKSNFVPKQGTKVIVV